MGQETFHTSVFNLEPILSLDFQLLCGHFVMREYYVDGNVYICTYAAIVLHKHTLPRRCFEECVFPVSSCDFPIEGRVSCLALTPRSTRLV